MAQDRVIISKNQAKAPFFVGVDLGGTGIKIGIVDDAAQTLAYLTIDTQVEKGPIEAVRRTADAIQTGINQAGLNKNDVVRVGLATPGTMDIPAGKLIDPANLRGWRNVPIRDTLAESCKIPVSYDNDANAAAFGEHWVGSGKDYNSMVMLTLGTGIGCGIVINGRTLIGENSHAGESGHNIIDPSENARVCNCGRKGHFEAYASATGVSRRIYELLEAGLPSSLQDRVDVATMTSHDKRKLPRLLYEEALNGDKFSIDMIKWTAKWLGIGIVTLMHTLDPHCVLIGGAMTFGGKGDQIGEMFLQSIRDEIHDKAYRLLAERLILEFAVLGGDAGYLGAAGVARDDYKRGA